MWNTFYTFEIIKWDDDPTTIQAKQAIQSGR